MTWQYEERISGLGEKKKKIKRKKGEIVIEEIKIENCSKCLLFWNSSRSYSQSILVFYYSD